MSRATITAMLLIAAATAHAQFVPPVLKGIKGDGTPRQTNGPIPFPAADEKWLLARSKHFVFISSADEKRTRSVAAELETLASALTQVDSTFSAPTATPTRVILFTRRDAPPASRPPLPPPPGKQAVLRHAAQPPRQQRQRRLRRAARRRIDGDQPGLRLAGRRPRAAARAGALPHAVRRCTSAAV